jgi:hypothetical protein
VSKALVIRRMLTAHRLLVFSSALLGGGAAQVRLFGFSALDDSILWQPSSGVFVEGAIGGALIGHLFWVLTRPRRRLSRAAAVCALLNVLVWCSYIIVTPPLPAPEFERIAAQRAEVDAGRTAGSFVTDTPIIVAGRWSGTFGSVNFADKLLGVVAYPANQFANLMVQPRYFGIDSTRGESFATAGLGFLLSTAFWVAFGGTVSLLRWRSRKTDSTPRVDR